jgi:multidrug transporter EmrE-like cation transporter
MIYLLLSILSSASIIVIFRLFGKWNIHTSDAIVFNYWVAALVGILLDPTGKTFGAPAQELWFYNAFIMGVLFITLFNIIGLSARHIGVSITAVANKMSLILPVLFAVWVLGDGMNYIKLSGILLAMFAVYLTSKTDKEEKVSIQKKYALFPLIVFIGSGFIDTFFKYNEVYTLGNDGLMPFLNWIFITASVIGLGVFIYNYIKHRKLPNMRAFLGGLLLGIPNYASVYFLVKTLSLKGFESSVIFPVNNMSVVAASALAGFVFFKEKMVGTRLVGIILCLIAIAFIAFSSEIANLIGL